MSARRSVAHRLREQAGHRHLHERRIAVVGVAVGVGQLDRFVDRMQVIGGVVTHSPQIDALEDVQRLQEHRPLIPRLCLVDVEAVKVDRRRLLDGAAE